jgi:hypothetical protein
MQYFAAMATSFLVLSLVGLAVRRLVALGARKPIRPPLIPDHVWNEHTRVDDGGDWLGFLERTLFFGAFWIGAVSIVAAWLAFKLASKWEVWKNVVRVPVDIEGGQSAEWFSATHTFGSWILQRFWIGTLLNVLLAMLAVGLGRALPVLWRW